MILTKMAGMGDDDIIVTPSGVNGPDLQLSPYAKKEFPFAIECKNQERINLWQAIEQSEGHAKDGMTPLLCITRNRAKVYAVIELEKFIEICQGVDFL